MSNDEAFELWWSSQKNPSHRSKMRAKWVWDAACLWKDSNIITKKEKK